MNISPIGFKSNPYSTHKTQKAQNYMRQNNSSPSFGITGSQRDMNTIAELFVDAFGPVKGLEIIFLLPERTSAIRKAFIKQFGYKSA